MTARPSPDDGDAILDAVELLARAVRHSGGHSLPRTRLASIAGASWSASTPKRSARSDAIVIRFPAGAEAAG